MQPVPPTINPITTLQLPKYQTLRLANGMELYSLNGGTEPVIKMEVVFSAGASRESKPGVAEMTAGLLTEGTQRLSSAALAEEIESLGATLQTRGGVDTSRIKLFTLTRFLPKLLELIKEIIETPSFDEHELKVFVDNKVERLKIELRKNEVIAYRKLTEAIYGQKHPYGRNTDPEHYHAITTADLKLHHQNYLVPQNGRIFLSGLYDTKDEKLIQEVFGSLTAQTLNGSQLQGQPVIESIIGRQEFDGPQTHQAAIRIGRKLFTPDHPDFDGLYVLNTILGGFFGSRLMTEIREQQGLTYGIYSGLDSFAMDGCFYISTETATANIEKVIEAIRAEVIKLQEELIDSDELDMARNYLMGNLMTQLDGPFASMDFIKNLKIERLPDSSFALLVDTIQQITPETLQKLARQYLDLDQWATIIVR